MVSDNSPNAAQAAITVSPTLIDIREVMIVRISIGKSLVNDG
jgi:hypothetical protein